MTKQLALAGIAAVGLVLTGCGPLAVEQAPTAPPEPTIQATVQAIGEEVSTAGPDEPRGSQLQTSAEGGESTATATGAASATSVTMPVAGNLQPLSAVEVVERVWPAVVTVVNGVATGEFGDDFVQQQGRGTGFIIDDQGHIVTNRHVVQGGNRLEVIFSTGEKRPAELVGTDRLSDLAVVRVDGDLPGVVSFGDSEALAVGQPVLAIGSPLGEFSGTVTDGIVSALNRDFPGQTGMSEYNNLIQHNAAINPGNSGGPLFDLGGNVIGVNTLGIPSLPTGEPVQGLFFAIPANSVERVASQLIEHGRAIYPFFGATRVEINPELAAQYDLPVEYGAYLVEVTRDQPAEQAGIQTDDIVIALDDVDINAQRSFSEALFHFEPGDTVTVTFVRGTREMQAEVTLAERPPDS